LGNYPQFRYDHLFGNVFRHFGDGHVRGNQTHLHGFAHHQHYKVGRIKPLCQKLGMSREIEFFTLDIVFIDGRGNKHINQSFLQVGNGAV
jgi:hypothetical protein